jgi:hypothetical protein
MALILIGVLLIIAGVVLSTLKTLKRGKLSQSQETTTGEARDTLEPEGRGDNLSLKSDVPGMALYLLGAILIFAGAIF